MTLHRSTLFDVPWRWLGVALFCAGLSAPAGAVPDHESYDITLGQARNNVRRENMVDDRSLTTPVGVAIDRGHTPNAVYVADQQNGRVLGWRNEASFMNGAPADLIIGQPDKFAMDRFRVDNKSFAIINGLAVDKDGTVWVSDTSHGRILGFKWPFDPSKPNPNFPAADFLIGQTDYTFGYYQYACNGGYLYGGPPGPTTNKSLCGNTGITTDPSGNLYVAEMNNNRVLVFKAPIPATGATATVLFGQTDYTVATGTGCNKGKTPDATTVCRPTGVYVQSDGAGLHLYVADTDNSRVLVFDDPLNNQTANRVFGQPSLTVGGINTGPDHMRKPVGIVVDAKGNLWVSDNAYHRVLGFSPPFHTAGDGASYVIGQVDANSILSNQGIAGKIIPQPTATTLWGPSGMDIDANGRLLLADSNNNRVLGYDTPAQMTPAAQHVLGQQDFVHGGPGRVKQSGMAYPVGVAVDRPAPASGEPIHVYVADFGNSRVLGWWDIGALYDGKPADVIIGQQSPGDTACNQGGGVSSQTLCWPRGVAVDKTGNVWVADTWNHRVLRFPKPFGRNQQVADLVLGQTSFLGGLYNGTGTASLNAHSMYSPAALVIDDNGVVWVADRDNDRVLGFGPPYANGMNATLGLLGFGIPDFNTAGCTARGNGAFLCAPSGLALDQSGNLWVADRDNSRVALYSTTPAMGSPLLNSVPTAVLGQPMITTGLPNNGNPIPSAKSLNRPEGVSVELKVNGDGSKTASAIVVADSANHRVLIYAPITSGLQPAATMVLGQNDLFTAAANNTDQGLFELPANVAKGLWNPGAVLALPEGLFISDSGTSSLVSPKLNSVQWLSNGTGNNRVVLLKGQTFPLAGMDASVLTDGGGVVGSPDLAVAPDLGVAPDLAQGPAPDLRRPGQNNPDLSTPTVPKNGCSCQAGATAGESQPLWGLVPLCLALGAFLRRRREKPATSS